MLKPISCFSQLGLGPIDNLVTSDSQTLSAFFPWVPKIQGDLGCLLWGNGGLILCSHTVPSRQGGLKKLNRVIIQAQELPQVNPSGSNCLGDVIRGHLSFRHPKQLFWQYQLAQFLNWETKHQDPFSHTPHRSRSWDLKAFWFAQFFLPTGPSQKKKWGNMPKTNWAN